MGAVAVGRGSPETRRKAERGAMPALHTLADALTAAVWLHGTAVVTSALVSVLARSAARRRAAHTTLRLLLRRRA